MSQYFLIDTEYDYIKKHTFYSIPDVKLRSQQGQSTGTKKKKLVRLKPRNFFYAYDPLKKLSKAAFQKIRQKIMHIKDRSTGKWKNKDLKLEGCRYITMNN